MKKEATGGRMGRKCGRRIKINDHFVAVPRIAKFPTITARRHGTGDSDLTLLLFSRMTPRKGTSKREGPVRVLGNWHRLRKMGAR